MDERLFIIVLGAIFILTQMINSVTSFIYLSNRSEIHRALKQVDHHAMMADGWAMEAKKLSDKIKLLEEVIKEQGE